VRSSSAKYQGYLKSIFRRPFPYALLTCFNYTGWGLLKKDERVYKDANQSFRRQNQYADRKTGLHYNSRLRQIFNKANKKVNK
ncbi:MAG: hypothetical protein ACLSID_13670, partial [Lactococcus lactis]